MSTAGAAAAATAGSWPLVCIMGPTAVGKSALALALAERLPVDLISVDSAAVYRGMDIGTAKPDAALRARHPHALIDIRDPTDPYTAGDFRRDALDCIRAARAAARVPVLVGGTMLYFRVLEQGIAEMPAADAALRASLDARERAEGLGVLYAELLAADPTAAARIDATNPQRVKRALEVYLLSGRGISSFWKEQAQAADDLADYVPLRVALVPDDRSALHRVIAARFDAMLAAGLLAEVAALRARGDLDASLPALRAVGYRQLWAQLEGSCDAALAREQAIAATRQLARRQLTWIRNWPELISVAVAPGGAPGPEVVTELAARVAAVLESGAGAGTGSRAGNAGDGNGQLP